MQSWWSEFPGAPEARWASLFFSLHVLTLLISIAAAQAFLAAATAAYAVYWIRRRPAVSFPPVGLPLLLFCLATFNSLLWAEHAAAGWPVIRKLVLFLILFLSVNLVVRSRQLEALLRGLAFVSAGAALLGMAQFVLQYRSVRRLHPDRIYFYMTLTRIHGFMGHWMNFGGQQMLVFALLAAFLLLAGGRERPAAALERKAKWLYGVLLGLIAVSVVLNFTRGVWLGCAGATLYLVARWRPRALWALPVLLLVGYLAAPSLVRRRVADAFHPSADPALAIRLEMWQVGLRMVRGHPWVGVGPENIPLVYTRYLPAGTEPLPGYHDHLHNNFLQLAAERGLPCLAAWLWFMLALAGHILRIRRRLDGLRWVADGALAAWLAFLAEGCFEFNFGTSPVLMLFLFVMSTPFIAENIDGAVVPRLDKEGPGAVNSPATTPDPASARMGAWGG
jgi:O-antigen ligase